MSVTSRLPGGHSLGANRHGISASTGKEWLSSSQHSRLCIGSHLIRVPSTGQRSQGRIARKSACRTSPAAVGAGVPATALTSPVKLIATGKSRQGGRNRQKPASELFLQIVRPAAPTPFDPIGSRSSFVASRHRVATEQPHHSASGNDDDDVDNSQNQGIDEPRKPMAEF